MHEFTIKKSLRNHVCHEKNELLKRPMWPVLTPFLGAHYLNIVSDSSFVNDELNDKHVYSTRMSIGGYEAECKYE